MTLDRPRARHASPALANPSSRVSLPGVALLIGALPFVVHAIVALQGYFGQDDFLIVYRSAGSNPADLSFLFQEYNGHLAPGMFVLAWAATEISPLSYPLLVVPLLAMQAYALVLFWRLLVDLFGQRWALLVPFAVYAFSPIILFSSLWWSYGVTLIPLLLSMFGALRAHVRYLRTDEPRQLVYTVLWILAGMAFYEKAVLFAGLLFGITVLLAPGAEGVRWAVRRYWRLWLTYGLLVLAYAALYLGLTGGTERDNSANSQIPELIRRMVLDTFLVPTAGVPVTPAINGSADVTPPHTAVQLLVTVATIGLVLAGVMVGRRRAVQAWLLLAGYLVMDVVLVVVARLSRLGAIIGIDSRYIADAVPVAALCATFVFLTPLGQPAESDRRPRFPLRAAVAGLTALMMVGTTISFLRLAPALKFAEARSYVSTARAGLAETPGIPLYDGPVPEELMISWFGKEARASRVVSMLSGAPKFDRPAERLYHLDRTGAPRLVERLGNTVAGQPGPVAGCGYAVTDKYTIVPLDAGVLGKRVVRLEYYTATAGRGWVIADKSTVSVTFESGVHVLYVPVEGLFGGIILQRDPAASAVCVGSVLVGEPVD